MADSTDLSDLFAPNQGGTQNLATTLQLINLNIAQLIAAVRNVAAFSNFIAAPATAVSTGTPGQVAYDSTHLYLCVATNSWVRVAMAAW